MVATVVIPSNFNLYRLRDPRPIFHFAMLRTIPGGMVASVVIPSNFKLFAEETLQKLNSVPY